MGMDTQVEAYLEKYGITLRPTPSNRESGPAWCVAVALANDNIYGVDRPVGPADPAAVPPQVGIAAFPSGATISQVN